MADYDPPTVEQFVAKFPEFTGRDAAITVALAEAGRSVDNTWTAGDYPTAIMYLAAHVMTVGDSMGAGGGAGEIASESLGPISVSYAKTSGDKSLYSSTQYGLFYRRLLKKNVPAIAVV
jgi:Protein of unknown function (DUF4054)